MPSEVLQLLAVIVDRPDFASIEKDVDGKRWFVGLFNGRRDEKGERKITWWIAPRLSAALLEAGRAPAPATLKAAGGAA